MPNLINSTILDFLKTNGPRLDLEIAEALKLPLTNVRSHVADLSSSGDLICCETIQFKDGVKVEGLSCRLSCYMPPPARGRKPAPKQNAESDRLSE